ncbi:hypothetical protein [Halobaculum lipolyticum]|uniref:Zinc ribbon domain-containing protein n=1 Tax=Halobaculum lipolyticum TaxID=3032001 RepID=A0ABD5WBW5_9EURY|nr:hypothetical protein [Halobaculum sp. DT31]
MTDRLHPLTAVGIGLFVAAVALAVGGVRALAVAGVLIGLGGLRAGGGASSASDAPDECPHCGISNPGARYCRWCDEDVTAAPESVTDDGADAGA